MPQFYYQIKGLDHNEDAFDKWAWPPLFSGRVEAQDQKEARAMVQAMYGEDIPGRVAKKDRSKPFILHVKKMDAYLARLFEPRACKQCGNEFRRIDLYNDQHEAYKGPDFCSQACANAAKAADMVPGGDDPYGNKAIPCIYRITNKPTGKVYIGQTRQAFTLRWWQHVKWGTSDCKFHTALRESALTDWMFEVVEVCEADTLDEREAHWIREHDAINNGYNTAKVTAAA